MLMDEAQNNYFQQTVVPVRGETAHNPLFCIVGGLQESW
jgi:hypothetical protein